MFLHALFHPTSIISSLWPSSVFTSSSSWTQPSNFSSQSLSKRPCCSRMKANSHKRWKVVARQLPTSGRFPSFSSNFKYIYILFSNSPVGSHFFNGSSVQKCIIFFHSRVKPGHWIQEKLDEIGKKKKKKKVKKVKRLIFHFVNVNTKMHRLGIKFYSGTILKRFHIGSHSAAAAVEKPNLGSN